MKVLHLVKHCALANGNVAAAVDLACAQAKAGLEVSFASAGGALEPLLTEHGVRVFRTPDTGRNPLKALKAERALLGLMLRLRPQIVHAHMLSSNLLGLIPARLVGARRITTVHNAFEPNAWMMGWADRTIAVSAANAADLIRRKVPEARVRVVRNGPIGSPRLPRPAGGVDLARPAVLSVCGLHHRKRVEDIIEAAALVLQRVPEARFYIAGEGPDEDKLREYIRRLDLEASVRLVGFQSEPLAWMKAADIFVLASEAEPFGLVLAEARSQGCALVATEVDGIPEVLEHGEAGLLVPPRSPAELAEAIASLLEDPARLAEFRARSAAGTDWLTVERMEENVREVYDETLG